MFCRADEDRPFTYSFDIVDQCTKMKRKLVNPISHSGSLTTKLRYDVGGSCAKEGNRMIMVSGTVTDRFGATAELCDIKTNDPPCPFVSFLYSIKIDNSADLINSVQSKLDQNQITGIEAVDELTFAVQARQAQNRDTPDELSNANKSKIAQELVDVLSIVKKAADDTLDASTLDATTRQTPRIQGWSLLYILPTRRTNESQCF